jgi:pyridoxine kinase
LRNNGWLNEIDAVITGYLPSADHVAIIAEEIDLLRVTTPELRYLCDPVLGDDPEGLYVSEALADAVCQELLPIADIMTPNRFELSWLTDTEVSGPDEAAVAIRDHKGRLVVATSIPAGDGLIANCLSGTEHQSRIVTRQHDAVPHGTGDLFAALLLGHLLAGRDAADALARATVGIRTVIEASLGAEELRLVDTIQDAIAAETAGVTSA